MILLRARQLVITQLAAAGEAPRSALISGMLVLGLISGSEPGIGPRS